jgi:DNA repair ATPase RecN
LVVFLGLFLFSGCSVIEEVNDSVNYVTTTVEYIQQVQNFANEAPQLLEEVTTDPTVLGDIEQKLTDLKNRTVEFNNLTPPEFAQEVHDSITQYSQGLETDLETILTNITEGKFDPNMFDSEVLQDLKSISELLEQVQNLEQGAES